MKSQISLAFKKCRNENRPALLTYTVAGDNTKKKSLEIVKSISEYADILELGFAHNAPTADGPQIQNSSYRALKNGIKLKDVFQIVKNYKKIKNAKPCILMGYYQMVYSCLLYTSDAADEEAFSAYKLVTELEEISPSLEPAHSFAEAIKIAPKLDESNIIVVNSCGDSLKDRDIIKKRLGNYIR